MSLSLPDQPIPQRMKVVTVMDCVPGNVKGSSQPITILTLAHAGEIEQPLMLTIRDTKKLVVDLLVSLDSHGDELARDVLDNHFSDDDTSVQFNSKERPEPPPPPPKPKPRPRRGRLTSRKASRVKFVVQYSYTYRPRNTLFVLSAYQNGPDVYVLYRIQGATDGLGKIVPPQQVILRDDDDPYRISEMEWEGFLALRDGESFLRNSRRWTKLAPETVAPIVAGKVFRRLLPDQK